MLKPLSQSMNEEYYIIIQSKNLEYNAAIMKETHFELGLKSLIYVSINQVLLNYFIFWGGYLDKRRF